MSRTIITGLTTLLVLFALFFLGGETIHGFAMALIVGVIVAEKMRMPCFKHQFAGGVANAAYDLVEVMGANFHCNNCCLEAHTGLNRSYSPSCFDRATFHLDQVVDTLLGG